MLGSARIPRYLQYMTIDADARPVQPGGEALTMTGQLAAAELRRGDILAGRFRIDEVT